MAGQLNVTPNLHDFQEAATKFLATPCSMLDLRSSTRDGTYTLCMGSVES